MRARRARTVWNWSKNNPLVWYYYNPALQSTIVTRIQPSLRASFPFLFFSPKLYHICVFLNKCSLQVVYQHHAVSLRVADMSCKVSMVCLHTGMELPLLQNNIHELNNKPKKNGTHILWEMGPRAPWLIGAVPEDSTIASYCVRQWRVWGGHMVVIGELDLCITKFFSIFVSGNSQKPRKLMGDLNETYLSHKAWFRSMSRCQTAQFLFLIKSPSVASCSISMLRRAVSVIWSPVNILTRVDVCDGKTSRVRRHLH